MTEDERRARGQTRRLVFENMCNGVPDEKLREDFCLSQLELDQVRRFVAKKITEYLVLRRQPPVDCGDHRAIRWNRKRIIAILANLGDVDLSTELILAKITVQSLDHPEMIEGAQHSMAGAYS
ncbi:hypothetical protein BH10PSE14_BH10PSE14_06770 [soil metagenome]